jgi:hypothetical protein
VKSFHLSQIANEELPGFRLAHGALEAHWEAKIALLRAGDRTSPVRSSVTGWAESLARGGFSFERGAAN